MVHMVTCLTNSSRMRSSSMVRQVQVAIRTEVSIKCKCSILKISKMMILRIRVAIRCRVIKLRQHLVQLAQVCPTQTRGEIEEEIDSRINSQVVVQMAEKMLQSEGPIDRIIIDKDDKLLKMLQAEVVVAPR